MLADLVARCPDLVVLATSRAPLRVRAEHEVVLSPLATPAADDVETVSLLPRRRPAARPGRGRRLPHRGHRRRRRSPRRDRRQLDGLPLALELAAPGLRLLSPTTLLTRLEQTGLGTGLRDLPERHRTMAAVLDWSMDLLEPEEVDLFERLAVFSGGFSLDDVEAVATTVRAPTCCPRSARSSTSRSCCACRRRTTSRASGCSNRCGSSRWRRLHASGLATATADRHAAHFHARASAFRDPLQGPDLVVALDRLEADHANLRSAYLRLLELDRDGDAAELAGSIWLYLALRGHAREGLAWLERIGPGASDVARCRALTGRLGLLLLTGDIEGMRRDTDEAVALARRVADPGRHLRDS